MTWRLALRGVGVSAALSIAVACAQGQDGIELGEGADPDAGTEGGARLPTSDSGGGSSGTNPDPKDDGGTDPEPGCTSKVVINELQANGPNGVEFVELFNPNGCAVSLAGWKLPYRADNNNSGAGIHTFGSGDSIAAGGFLLLATASINGAPFTKFNGGGRLGNGGGQIGLVDDTDTLVDALGYGPSTSGMFTEKSPAPLPSGSESIGRKSDGLDTDNNGSDFTKFSTPSPGVGN